MADSIYGGKILIVGDLHFSDIFTGKHKDYLTECFDALRRITDKVNEVKPSALVILGDLVGETETNIKNRQVFSMFCKVLKGWNEVCPVYSVRGNHDMKGYPDFNFLEEFGLIRTGAECQGYFDYYGFKGQKLPEIRFHLVDYNDEDRHLDICEDTSNVVLGHNNYTITGVTTWYHEHDGIELGLHENYADIDMVISGHIHNPSPEIVAVQMPGGGTCMLLYPGCPTRPIKERGMYESCLFVVVAFNEKTQQTDIDTEVFELAPLSEIFYEDEDFVDEKTEEEIQDELRKAALKDVLDDLLKYRMSQASPLDQIDLIPNASQDAKELAKKYLMAAMGG